jgi:O-antigen/teichoic acid export membrane protein
MKLQFLALVGTRVLAAVVQAAGFLVLSRVASVADVGLIGILTSIVTFAALVTDFGISTSLSRARARGEQRMVRGSLRLNDWTAVGLSVIGSLTIALLASRGFVSLALFLLLVSLVLERNVETSLSVFFADGNRRTPAISIIGRRLIGIGVFSALLATGVEGVLAYCIGQLCGNVFAQVQKSVALRPVYAVSHEVARVREVMLAAWPFWLSSVLNQVRVLDTAIVGASLSTVAAGLYSAAQRIVGPLMLIPTSLAQVVMPHATRQSGRDAARTAYKITAIVLLTYVPLVPIIVFSSEAMKFLFGDPYEAAGPILAWSMAGLPFLALANPLTAILQGHSYEKFIAANAGVFACLMLAAMVGGALQFGAIGVAAAIGVVSLGRCVVLLIVIWRRLGNRA